MIDRRVFLALGSSAAAGATLAQLGCGTGSREPLFRISLAQWSLHRAIRGGDIDPLDFAKVARQDFGIDAVEYVNQFYFDRGRDTSYLNELKKVADGEGVASLLIMCDEEGALGDPDESLRRQSVENHHKWVDAAARLGCHSVRVNAYSGPELAPEDQQRLVADGLRALCEYAEQEQINVLVENHGGLSSNGAWLAELIDRVDHPLAGTLSDFGNFLVHEVPEEWYDRYRGVREMMPFARSVSAKSYEFDTLGNETATDFERMMEIVLDAGYRGWVGIEYEGDSRGEYEGIRATKALLERVREELAPQYQ